MNKRRKFSWRECGVLLLPALALVGWGFWLQSRGPSEPFKLAIDEIQVSPVAKGSLFPPEPDSRGVRVVAFIGHKGPRPDWWGRGVNDVTSRVHFTAKGEKDRHDTNAGGYSGVMFDNSSQRYNFEYIGDIPKDPDFLKNATCHVSVSLERQTAPFKKLGGAKASIPANQFKSES